MQSDTANPGIQNTEHDCHSPVSEACPVLASTVQEGQAQCYAEANLPPACLKHPAVPISFLCPVRLRDPRLSFRRAVGQLPCEALRFELSSGNQDLDLALSPKLGLNQPHSS